MTLPGLEAASANSWRIADWPEPVVGFSLPLRWINQTLQSGLSAVLRSCCRRIPLAPTKYPVAVPVQFDNSVFPDDRSIRGVISCRAEGEMTKLYQAWRRCEGVPLLSLMTSETRTCISESAEVAPCLRICSSAAFSFSSTTALAGSMVNIVNSVSAASW
jgi:hypothetical protein